MPGLARKPRLNVAVASTMNCARASRMNTQLFSVDTSEVASFLSVIKSQSWENFCCVCRAAAWAGKGTKLTLYGAVLQGYLREFRLLKG